MQKYQEGSESVNHVNRDKFNVTPIQLVPAGLINSMGGQVKSQLNLHQMGEDNEKRQDENQRSVLGFSKETGQFSMADKQNLDLTKSKSENRIKTIKNLDKDVKD